MKQWTKAMLKLEDKLYNGDVNMLHSFLDMVATRAKVVG